jgi:hypothetical protein
VGNRGSTVVVLFIGSMRLVFGFGWFQLQNQNTDYEPCILSFFLLKDNASHSQVISCLFGYVQIWHNTTTVSVHVPSNSGQKQREGTLNTSLVDRVS